MKNKEVAQIFREIAQILDLKGENPFRIRAYEKAAQNIESMEEDLAGLAKKDELTSISGIGDDLAGKIKEIISTGTLKQYEELKRKIPEGVLKMLEIPGLGPKTVKLIYEKLKITTIEELEKSAKSGKLRKLEGVREKTEENILRGIQLIKKGAERVPISFALDTANEFLKELKKIKEIEKIEAAGSLRRRKETIRDIDILVVSKKPAVVMDKFVKLPLVKEVLAHGSTKSSIIDKDNMQVDLRVVENKSFGSALLYFTGSKDFNIKFRQLAIKKGYKVSEYGLFSAKGGKEAKYLVGKTEEEIFSFMKMDYIPPELREDRGEIDLAIKKKLPVLVELKNLKGDLHVHSKYSDGFASIEEVARKADSLGYEYVAITDHSQSLKIAGGLSKEKVYKKIEEIRKVSKKFKNLKILMGTEIDILTNGDIDYPESVLKEFDVVVAAIHTGFKQSRQQMTKRIVAACKNKYVNVIAHPTGGLWGEREPYEVNLDEVFKAARDYNVAMEINCHSKRLDLGDINAMKAKAAGLKLALGTDAHMLDQMDAMRLGVDVARRAWLGKEDIVNCMGIDKLQKWLKK
jgi:DNA polymerase (family 10)